MYRSVWADVMDQLLQNLNRAPGALLVALLVAMFVLALVVVYQLILTRRFRRRWNAIMAEASGENLESLLERHMVERQSIEDRADHPMHRHPKRHTMRHSVSFNRLDTTAFHHRPTA